MKARGDYDTDALISSLEKMLKLSVVSSIDKEINNIREITDIFFIIISHLGIDVEDLYKRYVVKNQLNTLDSKMAIKMAHI